MQTLFSEERRQLLEAARKKKAPPKKKKPAAHPETKGHSYPPVKVTPQQIRHWAAEVADAMARGFAPVVEAAAKGKDISLANFWVYRSEPKLKELFLPYLEKQIAEAMKGSDASLLTYLGRGTDFDRDVLGPVLKKFMVWALEGAKYSGFGPLSIQMRVPKMSVLPGDKELTKINKVIYAHQAAYRKAHGLTSWDID